MLIFSDLKVVALAADHFTPAHQFPRVFFFITSIASTAQTTASVVPAPPVV